MNLSKIVEKLKLEIIAGYNNEERNVKGVYIGDLLSLVMAKADVDDVWITIQTHVNIIAVATLVELSSIIVVEGMEIDEDTIKKANESKTPILKTSLSAYELACKLKELGI